MTVKSHRPTNDYLVSLVGDGHTSETKTGLRKYDEIFATLSLKKALIAYFSTHKNALRFTPGPSSHDDNEPDSSSHDGNERFLFEPYLSIIVHLQHFAELLCKSILREKHELLATVAYRDHVLFYDLLGGVRPTSQMKEKIQRSNSLEFSETLERTVSLLKSERLDKTQYSFITENQLFLKQLNTLRNRILHRATFVLTYQAIDILFASYVIPFIQKAGTLKEYLPSFWKYKKLYCGLDPLDEICAVVSSLSPNKELKPRDYDIHKKDYDLKRVAFLKQLGLAAYANPRNVEVENDSLLGDGERMQVARAERRAADLPGEKGKCPVCGADTLVIYIQQPEEVLSLEDLEEGEHLNPVIELDCILCTFSTDLIIGKEASQDYRQLEYFHKYFLDT